MINFFNFKKQTGNLLILLSVLSFILPLRIFSQYEDKMQQLQSEKLTLEAQMADPATYADPSLFSKVESRYKQVENENRQLNEQYEIAFEQLAALEK